ncbi:MAG: hypothetical protein Q9160_001735 [Pyrenula sp. 1 TL-2023]
MPDTYGEADVVGEKRRLSKDGNSDDTEKEVAITLSGEVVNASGHRDQLSRQYGLLSICGLALTVDNAWIAIGTSLSLSIFNGGPPGVIYEFLVAVLYYAFINASLAELASSIPSAGGVYHWASITPGLRAGRALGFFAGSLNFFGWLFDLASISYIMSQLVVSMYGVYHPEYTEPQPWHYFVTLVCITWLCIAATIFLNKYLPVLQQFGLFMVVVGGIVTIIVIAAMPERHASNSFVWKDFDNTTGWSGGVAFLTGILNGAFTVGTPDSVTHIAEELPNPRRDLPRAIFAQIILGAFTAFFFIIALFYGISDLPSATSNFPLAGAYSQATNGSAGATFGLLFIAFLSLVPCLVGTFLTVGRTWWALARDNATPFPRFFSSVHEGLSCPIPATILTGLLTTAFCAITLGSKTAFSDLAGSFIILTTTSYALAIGGNLFTARKNIPRGPFHMPGAIGFSVNAIALVLIVFFNIIFCFPYALPTTGSTMNYNCVILVGVVVLTAVWWAVHGWRRYPGPKVAVLFAEEMSGGGAGENGIGDREGEGEARRLSKT